jgi:hypothetical protein
MGRWIGVAILCNLDRPGIDIRPRRRSMLLFATAHDTHSLLLNGYRASNPGLRWPRRGVEQTPILVEKLMRG